MVVVHAAAIGLAVGGWLLAAFSALRLVLHHRAPERTLLAYATQGMLFFNAENFAPTGAAWHRRMLVGFAGFTAGFLLAVIVTVVGL